MSGEGQKLWGGRFDTQADDIMWKYNASISLCKRLWKEDLDGSIVYAKALEMINIISDEELELIIKGLSQIKEEWKNNKFILISSDEDIHTANERRLSELISKEIGGKLHTARSRNDQVQTDVHLWIRNAIHEICTLLSTAIAEICSLAEKHIDLLMPSYTHFQPAQVIRFSHWLMSHAEALRLNLERFKNITSHKWCPLGSGAIAGNALGIDREFIARELGFELGPSLNSINSTGCRDAVMDFLYCVSTTFISLSRMSEDFILFSSPQFKFFNIGQQYSTGSSLMPQKQNPDALELIRGKCGTVNGQLMGFLMSTKGIPSGYNKDLQEDKSAIFSSFDTLTDALKLIAGIVHSIEPNPSKINSSITSDMLATDIAYFVVRQGKPFREAHSIAGELVNKAEKLNLSLDQLNAHQISETNVVFGDGKKVEKLLKDAERSVEQYTSTGGTSRNSVLQTIETIGKFSKQ